MSETPSGPTAEYRDANRNRFREELFDFLRIPSVSAKSEHTPDVVRAAEWLKSQMEMVGLTAEVLTTPGHPVVLGEIREAGDAAPTVLIYGHYDVQPAEPLEEWVSPAFEPTVRDGNIYARGSADDKGQLFLHLKAIECYRAAYGTLPVNVVFLAEGEEEVGSPNLVPFVERHKERLGCDVVVISDSAMFAPDLPSILFSLRGLAYFEVTVQGARGDLHSGAYGGAVVNPAAALAGILDSLHDDEGRISIDSFYDDVVEWDEDTRSVIRSLPFVDEEFRASVGAPSLGGEEGFSTLERIWIRPTCEVNGLLSGYTGEGAKTVLPAKAMAKVSFRLVPDQNPDRVEELFRAHLEKVTPGGVTVNVTALHGGPPWRAELSGAYFEAAKRAYGRAFGVTPVLTGEGGSIPIVSDFERILGVPALLLGFALPGANMHAPNEWFAVRSFEKGIETLVYLYEELRDQS